MDARNEAAPRLDAPLAPIWAECRQLCRDGHFYGAISLSHVVAAAFVRHFFHTLGWTPGDNFEGNVAKLRMRGFIDPTIADQLVGVWKQGEAFQHLNDTIPEDRARLAELAQINLRALDRVEAWAVERIAPLKQS
jgi:hypothetical protein